MTQFLPIYIFVEVLKQKIFYKSKNNNDYQKCTYQRSVLVELFSKVSGRKGWYAQSSSPSPDNLNSITDIKVKLTTVLDFNKRKN